MQPDEKSNMDIRVVDFFKKMHQMKKSFMDLRDKSIVHPDVTHTQMMIMSILTHMGRMKIGDISEEIGLSISTVSGILDRMEEQGYICRERSKDDRRVVYVALEEKYKKFHVEMMNDMNSKISNIIEKMTDEEYRTVNNAFDILNRILVE